MKHTLDWNEYLRLAAQAAAEGIVMLRNQNQALPLAEGEEIAVFGRIQLHYYKSGTGSGGMVNVSHVVSITDGLRNAGIRLYEPLRSFYEDWDADHPYDLGNGWGGEPWSQKEMPLDDAIVADAARHCKRAVVIIGRTAGEEQDNRDEPGSYRLTVQENQMLSLVRAHFEKVIVLLNTANLIDLSFMDTCSPDAVLLVWQGGMTGGTGTADVLTGRLSPCGKLPDTAAYALADYPSDPYFGGRSMNFYAEDIYVGYRYFETFAPERVRFPFGFGLSYTTFSLAVESCKTGAHSDCVMIVNVRNTGSYAGKEVVQIYCEMPQGRLGQPKRRLIAFRKTKLLTPGETETLRIPCMLPVSYDDSGVTGHPHAWVQESGEYRLCAGTDVRNAVYAASVYIDPERVPYQAMTSCRPAPGAVVIRQCAQAMAPVQPFQRFRPVRTENGFSVGREDVPLQRIS